MRWLWARIAFLLVIVGPIAASAQQVPSVLSTTPGADGNGVARFTMRFSEAMAAADSRDSPINMRCVVCGEGSWADSRTFVWEFANPLPGDTVCTATLVAGLKTAKGTLVGGKRAFTIDTGGPFAKTILPQEGDAD